MLKYEKPLNEKEKQEKAEKDYKVSQKKLRMNELRKLTYPAKQKALLDRQRKAIDRLKQEVRGLETDIGITQKRFNTEENGALSQAHDLIEEEAELKEKIENEKQTVKALSFNIDEVKKSILSLQKTGLKETTISEKIKKEQVKLEGFESSLQVATNKFGDLLIQSEGYREKISVLLDERKIFHTKYMQLYTQLLRGKQTMLDVVEQATKVCDQKEETSRKLRNLQQKTAEEVRNHNEWVQQFLLELEKNRELGDFLNDKNEKLFIDNANLELKRAEFRLRLKEEMNEKLNNFRLIFDDIKELYDEIDSSKIIDRYITIEEENMGLVCYVNNQYNDLLTLQDEIRELNLRMVEQQERRENEEIEQQKTLTEMGKILEMKTAECHKAVQQMKNSEWTLNRLLMDLQRMFIGYNCDSQLFLDLLGDNAHVNVFNYQTCLSQIENQIHEFLYLVYCKEMLCVSEYEDEPETVIQDDYHLLLSRRPVDYYIGALSPCALCQEMMHMSNWEEEDKRIELEDFETLREEIRSAVIATSVELLHNLSKCQLPRSRAIMQARFQEESRQTME